MLEQRRATEKGYITLKEAAALTGYTPDYVGQLVRAGKIKGEQVYSGVAWVTTEDEISTYFNQKGKGTLELEKVLFFESDLFKYFLYALICVCVLFLLFFQYILYMSIDEHFNQHYLSVASADGP